MLCRCQQSVEFPPASNTLPHFSLSEKYHYSPTKSKINSLPPPSTNPPLLVQILFPSKFFPEQLLSFLLQFIPPITNLCKSPLPHHCVPPSRIPPLSLKLTDLRYSASQIWEISFFPGFPSCCVMKHIRAEGKPSGSLHWL